MMKPRITLSRPKVASKNPRKITNVSTKKARNRKRIVTKRPKRTKLSVDKLNRLEVIVTAAVKVK